MWCIELKTNKLCFALLCLLASVTSVSAFNSNDPASGNIHAKITRDALKGVFSEPNLKVIIDANSAQDQPGSEALQEARRHFGDPRFTSSLGYIDREKKRALNYAAEADVEPESRGQALRHIGEMLHVVQDFYSRTNYLELMLEDPVYKADPYNIPLVDWQKVPDGYAGLECAACGPGLRVSVDKDHPNTIQGQKTLGDTTYFRVVFDLASRETQRQWNLFETMLRRRCGPRAPAVIAALKQASPAIKASLDPDD